MMPLFQKNGEIILIIPDLHHRWEEAEFWIARFAVRQVVFLGDYFDDFHDSVEDAGVMAAWVRGAVEAHPDWVFLVGNHDLPYLYPMDERLMGPGFHLSKREEIGGVIKGLDRSRFRLHHWIDNDILLSHAGLHPGWLRQPTRSAAEELLAESEECLLKGLWHPLLSWGRDRGAISSAPRVGGITWMDWANLKPLPFCHQIVGHTVGLHPRHKTFHGIVNLCIDLENPSGVATISHISGKEGAGRVAQVWRRSRDEIFVTLEVDLPILKI